ncbi:hypothetical protein CN514_15435 [Bacillus sp. AFS001701]|uniref:helix-turn-helix domain-containing protein n=1 Tax=Bacillus sp. AFS001701 TaxID=2033480 RepID=UPI000BF720FC|nr:helix-turn-helix domain-containing protein [Bacillus sp. AFS001701]PET57000.1 hypothetical protein CN514_15435 [Bacillus sp. AFS001701]
MHRFMGRYADLIIHFFNGDNWHNLADLSLKTGFSKSTIWRDLEFLETVLPKGWQFEKDDTRGIFLKKPENGTLENLLGQIRDQNEYFQILKLIILNNGVDISQITENVHISRSTAYRHLEKIKQLIKESGISLSVSPFKLEGDEKVIRHFILGFLQFMDFDPESESDQNIDAKNFQSKLLELGSKYSVSFRTGAIDRLSLYIFISNLRVSMEYYVKFPLTITINSIESRFMDFAKELVQFMVKCPNRELQLQEMYSYVIYLMSEEKPPNRSEYIKYAKSILRTKRGLPVLETFKILEEHIGFNLSEDELVVYYWFQKIKRMLIETEFGIGMGRGYLLQYAPYFESNPFYKTVEEIVTRICIENDLKPNEHDILDFFLLVQTSLLRKKERFSINTALISRSNIEKNYVESVLKYHFCHALSITKTDAFTNDYRQKYDEYDLIITTDSKVVGVVHVPRITISAIPLLSEINKIREFIDEKFAELYGLDASIIYPFTDINQ